MLFLSLNSDPFGRGQTGGQFTLLQGTAVRGYTNQYQNAVQYITPSLAGFLGRVIVAAGEGTLNKNYGAGLDYRAGKLFVGAAYDDVQTAGAAVGLPAVADTRSKTYALGATYDLDVVKLFGYMQSNRVSGLANVNGYLLGATAPVGLGQFQVSATRTDRSGANADLLAVGYFYFLSKRTQVYASVARLRNEGTARFGMWPAVQDLGAAGVPAAGQDVTGAGIGIRHLF
jgi:predicted porin